MNSLDAECLSEPIAETRRKLRVEATCGASGKAGGPIAGYGLGISHIVAVSSV